jgi:membrane-bound inhibitor of C-type lysozyme
MWDILRRAACAALLVSPAAAAEKSAPVVYKCPDGSQIVAVFTGAEKASLSLSSGEVLSLTSALSGSGARYLAANGDEFWTHRNDGTLTRKGHALVCHTQ